MSKELSFSASREVSYDNKVQIEVRLKTTMSKDDYKTVVDAANLILETVTPYLEVKDEQPTTN